MPGGNLPSRYSVPVHDENLYRDLERAATRLGKPVADLVQSAIAHELQMLEADFEAKLAGIADRLPAYRRPPAATEAAEFARAEVEHEDPLRARRIEAENLLGELLGRRVG